MPGDRGISFIKIYNSMTRDEYTKFEASFKNSPHVVLLGAGASCAAIPQGDRNGLKISAMDNFIQNLGLGGILNGIELHTNSKNLEVIYQELAERAVSEIDCQQALSSLKKSVWSYMSKFELPDSPTVYDYLLLSMTMKDVIATFNWDPLLVQAYMRVARFTRNLPELLFLHGNVAIGFCEHEGTTIAGPVGGVSPYGEEFEPSPLLFPIKEKGYNKHVAIARSWEMLQRFLSNAYMVTIFGYSAPESDVEAIALLSGGWGDPSKRRFEQIEIIDIATDRDYEKIWEKFIFSSHYQVCRSFFESSLGKHPRRTCEAIFDQNMNVQWLNPDKGWLADTSFEQFYLKLSSLFIEERKPRERPYLSHPYILEF